MTEPTLVCVTFPDGDDSFRLRVHTAVAFSGPDAHRRGDGIDRVVSILRESDPEAAVDAAILTSPDRGALQIWWYVHRDGSPSRVM